MVYFPQVILPPQLFQPSQPYQLFQTFQQMPFQTPSVPPKKSKRRNKKAETMPLINIYNEKKGNYDNAISIRKMFQQHKVDISWMDLIAWSPTVNKKIKRLCIRVSKPRQQKIPRRDALQQFTYQFNLSMQSFFFSTASSASGLCVYFYVTILQFSLHACNRGRNLHRLF